MLWRGAVEVGGASVTGFSDEPDHWKGPRSANGRERYANARQPKEPRGKRRFREESQSGATALSYCLEPRRYPSNSFATVELTFDASNSTDDVGVVAFEWKRASGVIIGTTKVTTFTFSTGGSKTITLKVTDGGGLTGTITKTINVP